MLKLFNLIILVLFLVVLFGIHTTDTQAFPYLSLPSDNLIQNPWFADKQDCQYSGDGWSRNAASNGVEYWANSAKWQDPIDVNCDGDFTGFAARFARKSGSSKEFYPNEDARLWQVVGPVNQNDKTLHFHFLFVAHRVNQYKAEIYGSNSPNGPWTSIWVPLNITNCLSSDCVNNSPPGDANSGDRTGLWEAVAKHFFKQSKIEPLVKTIPQGYQYYKVEFLMNYPNPSSSATGDVGGKLVRVYFKTSSGGGGSTPTPTPRTTATPTSTPVSDIPGDADGNGNVDGLDYIVWLNNYNINTAGGASKGDFDTSGKVDGVDYLIWLNNYGG